MARQYSGSYICSKCNWKSSSVSFGSIHGWNLKKRNEKLVEEYRTEFGDDYLKKILIYPYLGTGEKKDYEPNLADAKRMYSEENVLIKNNQIFIKKTVEFILMKSSWRPRPSFQCHKCYHIFSGLTDIYESELSGVSKRKCPKCNSYGEKIMEFANDLFCPKCKKKTLKFHRNMTLIT